MKHIVSNGDLMKNLKISVISIIILFLLSSISAASDWVLFFKSAAKYDFFYDKDSLKKTNENTVLVWQKIVPQKEAEIKAWVEATELREVDCNRRKYKILAGKTLYENKPMKIKKESEWIYLEPDDLDSAFYKKICEE